MNKRIAFHLPNNEYNEISLATIDMADWCGELLDANVSIICREHAATDNLFKKHLEMVCNQNSFDLISYRDDDIKNIIKKINPDHFYHINSGHESSFLETGLPLEKTFNHSYDYYGDERTSAYSYKNPGHEFLPFIVNPPFPTMEIPDNPFGIPEGANIFAHIGHGNIIELGFVRDALYEIAEEHENIYFILFNTINQGIKNHPKIKFVDDVSIDRQMLTDIIEISTGVIDAHFLGDPFGSSIRESLLLDTPVIAYQDVPRRHHIDIIGDEYLYTNKDTFKNILLNIIEGWYDPINIGNLLEEYRPIATIIKFAELIKY